MKVKNASKRTGTYKTPASLVEARCHVPVSPIHSRSLCAVYAANIALQMQCSILLLTYKNNFSLHGTLYQGFTYARTVNIWNSLPNYVVDVQPIDVFKVHLVKFWVQQEVMFDWTADLTRSEYTVESYYIYSYN